MNNSGEAASAARIAEAESLYRGVNSSPGFLYCDCFPTANVYGED